MKTLSKEFIEVGCMALRDPKTGECLPAVKLYIEATPEARKSEIVLHDDMSKLFADNMKRYIKGGGVVAKTGKR